MGQLSQRIGEKPNWQMVIVPFDDDDADHLIKEVYKSWEPAKIFRVRKSELTEDITQPQKTVLYVLAHSGRGVSFIASGCGPKSQTKTAEQLVRYLVDGGLPPRILAVKIWACFTGVNGFAQEVKAKFLAEPKGYNPIVVGYNEGTGGPYSEGEDDHHKYVYQVDPVTGGRGAVIGRGSANRTIF